jgi:transposase
VLGQQPIHAALHQLIAHPRQHVLESSLPLLTPQRPAIHRAHRRPPRLTRYRLHRFLPWCIDSQIPELLTLAATIDTWWPEINAYIDTGITNARTEGHNRLVEQVKRVGCGFRNTGNSARRIRFH